MPDKPIPEEFLVPSAKAALDVAMVKDLGFYHFVKIAWKVIRPGEPFVGGWHIEMMCKHLEAVSYGKLKRLIINVPPGMSKPVSTDAMVLERVRGRIRLGDVCVGDEVLTHRGRFRRVLAVHEQGTLPLVTLTTFRGRVVEAAEDHPFLTPRGWVNAGDLTERDVLATTRVSEYCGRATITHEAARLLGYLVGDGSCIGQPIMTTETEEIALDVEKCASSLGFFTRRRAKEGNKSGAIIIKNGSDGRHRGPRGPGGVTPLRAWMDLHALSGKSSYTKRVPSAVMAGDDDVVRNFLGAYWCCDGYLSSKAADRSDIHIGCDTVSRGLAEDLQHLLYRLGIEARVRTKVAKLETASQPGGRYVSYTLIISSQDDAARFMAAIPMVHPKKQRGLGLRRIEFDQQLRSDPVESIERTRSGPCRCLTVEEDESFTANDLVVHNSTVVSVLWPVWDWIRKPSRYWIAVTFDERLAGRDAMKCRELLESDWFKDRWGNIVAVDISGKTQLTQEIWHTTRGGRRYSTTVSGGMLGWHGNIIVVDDPLKPKDISGDPEVARGALDRCWKWWTETVENRLLPGGAKVIIMQRLHELDLVGRILELEASHGSKEWVHLMLPMRFEPDRACMTPLGVDPRRTEGELLCPERFDLETVQSRERGMGAQVTAAQYQQRPAPAGGNVFQRKWFARRWMRPDNPKWAVLSPLERENYVPLPRFFSGALSLDCAFKDVAGADNTALVASGEHESRIYILDCLADRIDLNTTTRCLEAFAARYPFCRAKLIEDKANGPAVEQTLRKRMSGIIMINPEGGKVARANAVSPLCEAGDVIFPDESEAGWVAEFIEELVTFPFSRRDDRVDAFTQLLNYLHGHSMARYLQAMQKVASGEVRFGDDYG